MFTEDEMMYPDPTRFAKELLADYTIDRATLRPDGTILLEQKWGRGYRRRILERDAWGNLKIRDI